MNYLRSSLDRALDRARYARRELHQFASTYNPDDPVQARTHRKLAADLERAEMDAVHAKAQLT